MDRDMELLKASFEAAEEAHLKFQSAVNDLKQEISHVSNASTGLEAEHYHTLKGEHSEIIKAIKDELEINVYSVDGRFIYVQKTELGIEDMRKKINLMFWIIISFKTIVLTLLGVLGFASNVFTIWPF